MPGLNLYAGIAQETAFGLSMRNVAPPAPTTGPNLYPNALGIRQDASSGTETEVILETCAWFSHTVTSLGWEALHCEDPCTTSGTLFGCEVIPTTCIDYEQTQCQGTAVEAWCCDTTFPYCITGVLEQDGNTFTAFRCGNDALSGEMPLYVDTSATLTTVVTSGDERTTVTVVETPTEEPTSDSNDSSSGSSDDNDNGNPDEKSDSNKDNEGSSSGGGGGGAPIGAIVGGVIGGIALIVAVGFAIWFIRFQKKKKPTNPDAAMEPYRYDANAAYAGGYPQQQQQQQGAGGYDYSQGGYNNQGQYGMGPLPTFSQAGGSPKPEEQQMQQAPVEMPGYSNYGVPSELPSESTTRGASDGATHGTR